MVKFKIQTNSVKIKRPTVKMKFACIFCFLLLFIPIEFSAAFRNCPNPVIKSGRYRFRQKGRLVKFICNSGYTLAGDRYSTCINGNWENPPPKCVRPTCKPVKQLNNGLIYPSFSGSVLYFYCKSNYLLNGPNVTFCDGVKWDNNAPACIPADKKPALFCDFENEDLCGWGHDLNHDFDWVRMNYQTPSGSIGTGPSFDHSKGPGRDGYYMYIESSSRNENDTARLISPVFSKTANKTCLEFWYHMYGTSIGSLRVYIKKFGQSWALAQKMAIFHVSGNQGDQWYRSFHELDPIDDDYQVVIEGVRGSSYISDIAIDDVRIIENCTGEQFTTTTEEMEVSFETPLPLDSCENACGLKYDHLTENHYTTCDCDDECVDRSRCCPDYMDYCAFPTSVSDEVEYFTTRVSDDLKITATAPSTIKRTTMKKTAVTTRKQTTVLLTTNSTTTTIKPTTKTTTTTMKPTTKSTTLPTLPPLRPIIRNDKSKNPISKVIYVKPDGERQKITNDMLTVPQTKTTDRIEVLTVTEKVQTLKEKIIVPVKSAGGVSGTLIVFVGVFGALFLVGAAVFVVRRYKFGKRIRSTSNGDSQSDVRFLTSDEILDFDVSY